MSIYPVGDAAVSAALAAMPLEIRAGRAADYVFLMRRAQRMDKISPDTAAQIRAQAAAVLVMPVARACDHCGGPVGAAGTEFHDAALGVQWRTCEGCELEAESIVADHRS